MGRVPTKLAALACAGLALAACEGSTISAPESARYACGWAQEGGGCDPVDNTKYSVFTYKSEFYVHRVGGGAQVYDEVEGRSYTTAVEGTASVTVKAELRHDKYCDNSYDPRASDTKTVSGMPAAAVVYFKGSEDPFVKNRWRINGTHSATAATGYVAQGPWYSSATSSCL